jgi:hypothetical protein
MNLNKLLAMLKPKPKPRPIYVGDQIVGWDDGLPNSIKIDRKALAEGLMGRPVEKAHYNSLIGLGRVAPSEYEETEDEFADIGFTCRYAACTGVTTGGAYQHIRSRYIKKYDYSYTMYWSEIAVAQATSDVGLWKSIDGTATNLGREAVDITAENYQQLMCLQATSTTISLARVTAWRVDWACDPDASIPSTDFRITVTDTDIASGVVGLGHKESKRYTPSTYWGAVSYFLSGWTESHISILRPPSSELSPPVKFFEVPVEEFHLPEVNDDGTVNLTTDFYSVKLPEEIVVLEKPVHPYIRRKKEILERKGWSEEEIRAFLPEAFPNEKINRLAVTWSALIPTDKSGKPIHGTAILRVFGGSPEYVHPIEKRIQAIKEMRGVRELSREEAIDLALKMDDKLHIHDLVPCTKHELGGKCFKEYRDWRIYTVGDKPEFADTDIRKRYVKEMKGW